MVAGKTGTTTTADVDDEVQMVSPKQRAGDDGRADAASPTGPAAPGLERLVRPGHGAFEKRQLAPLTRNSYPRRIRRGEGK